MKCMKKINNIFLIAILMLCFTGCSISEIDKYTDKNALFFPKTEVYDSNIILDSVFASFSHYPGIDELSIPFKVSLIGRFLDQDKEYSISVVESEIVKEEL